MAFLVTTPYQIQGVDEKELGPQRTEPRLPPSPALQVAQGSLSLHPVPGFTRPLCLISSCFLCLFVLLVWFPVLSISHLVFPCLFSCEFLLVALHLSSK